ncbi:MAG: hypothetical protein KKB62_00720 [Nanoarchaeota archaeon]|nr:hypothetical protein [Nanoarchaeota archaeon]
MEQDQEMTPEQKEERYKTQKEIFSNDFIKYIALSKIGEQTDRYGKFGKDTLDAIYLQTASKAPDQTAYQNLFGEAVLGNGSLTKEQLKINAQRFWASSVAYQKVSDLAKKMEYNGPISGEFNKYVHELDEENLKLIQGSYLQYEVNNLMKKGLEIEQKAIAGGLEEILKPKAQTPKEKGPLEEEPKEDEE